VSWYLGGISNMHEKVTFFRTLRIGNYNQRLRKPTTESQSARRRTNGGDSCSIQVLVIRKIARLRASFVLSVVMGQNPYKKKITSISTAIAIYYVQCTDNLHISILLPPPKHEHIIAHSPKSLLSRSDHPVQT
jgi:hypothetical protein